MTRIRLFMPALVLLALLGIGSGPAAAQAARIAPEQAASFIQTLGQRAVSLLASYKPSEAAKSQQQFNKLLEDGFDLDLIGRFVLGNAWRNATPAQRQEYQQLFTAYVLDTYSVRIGAYRGETFRVTGSHPLADTDALVDTEIVRPDGPPIKAGWRVRSVKGQPKIIDVMVEGVSMALTQRQEFAAVIQNKGLDGLIADLRARVQSLQKQAGQG